MTGIYLPTDAPTGSKTVSAYPLSNDDGNDPAIVYPGYHKNRVRGEKCEDVYIGTEAIREGRTDYLPRYAYESLVRYEVRRVIAAFRNKFARTVDASVGMLLHPEPTFDTDMPSDMVELAENVDNAGTHLTVFSRKLLKHGLIHGITGIFTDYSRPDLSLIQRAKASLAATIAVLTGGRLDSEDEKRLGLRPYFIMVRAGDYINRHYEVSGGSQILTQFVRMECMTERHGLFGRRAVKRYRVYDLIGGRVIASVYVQREGQVRAELESQPQVMQNATEIPWSPLIAGTELDGRNVEDGEVKPPLIDQADMNIEHHQTLTNMLSLQSLAFVPTPWRIGAQPYTAQNVPAGAEVGDYPPMILGPGNVIEIPLPEPGQTVTNPVGWLTPDVSVMTPAFQTLEACEKAMDLEGGAFMAPDPNGVESFAAKKLRGAAQRANLSTVSRAFKDCLELACKHAMMFKKKKGGSVKVNEDFVGVGVDPQIAQVMISAYLADPPAIDFVELRTFLQTGQLPEGFDPANVKLIGEMVRRREAEVEDEADNAPAE